MTAALRGNVRAQWRTSRVPTAVDGARPRPARNSAATPSYPLDRSIISGLFQFLEPNGLRSPLVGGIGYHPGAFPGRDNAILTEPASSHANCPTARRAC